MNFEQRIGIAPLTKSLQIDSIDDDLKNSLWNALKINLLDAIDRTMSLESFALVIWIDYFKEPIDSLPKVRVMSSGPRFSRIQTEEIIKNYFFSSEWSKIYMLLEFCLKTTRRLFPQARFADDFIRQCNIYLEREFSGYRIINDEFVPITNEIEINEINETLSNLSSIPTVNNHLKLAIDKLSDKANPDYRNSIKESICAVESLVNLINESKTDSLGQALNKISEKIPIDTALKEGFKKIYGYTSNQDGIRHGMSEESTCSFEDAKYMLVACSAFINYLIAKADKAGIKL